MRKAQEADIQPVFLREKQAAKLTGISGQTLRIYRCKRKGPPYIKKQKSVFYDREALIAWMNEGAVDPEAAE